MTTGEPMTVHYVSRDGAEGSQVLEPGPDGTYTWQVPQWFDGGIVGFTTGGGSFRPVPVTGGGAGPPPPVQVTPGAGWAQPPPWCPATDSAVGR